MTRRFLAYLALIGLAVAVYLVLVLWGGARLAAQSGGLSPFDLRFGGYDLPQAQAYLAALTDEGRRLYLGPIRRLDTAVPVLFALVLGIGVYWRGRGLAPALRLALVVPALAYGLLDLTENARVATLLQAEAVTAEAVARASGATVGKFLAFAAALGLPLLLLARRLPPA